MVNHWIISSKFERDESTKDWYHFHRLDYWFKEHKFWPYQKEYEFEFGDKCLLRVFTEQILIADFEIKSGAKEDDEGVTYYDININEWDFFVDTSTLPDEYKKLLQRAGSIKIDESYYYKLIGIKDFNQNLKLNYKNRLVVKLKEKTLEDFLDSFENPLKKELNYTILYRQREISKGNRIDLICKDEHGDLVVIELKRESADETIGQLARYIAYVRENLAKKTQKVKGLILALDIDEPLIKGARAVDLDVKLYQIKTI